MSLSAAGNIADLNNDGIVNYLDTKLFSEQWPIGGGLLAEDVDRDGLLRLKDFAIFAANWAWEEP